MTAGADIFARRAPRIFSIEPGRPFLEDLALALRAGLEKRPDFELADALIYLPTRRAVRALAEAFVATAPDARASLLPQIRALGDIDEDEFVVFDGDAADEIDLPPAISSMERRLTLARMVAARDRAFDGHERWAGALAAADELGKLLDSFYAEEIAPEKLRSIVPDTLAEHWRDSLKFLSIIIDAWPKHLSELGLMDPAARRVALIDRQTARWKKTPPGHPVIVAGTTGSAPAVARMMKTVAALPFGCVVLPGLDTASDARFWDAVDETHPQSGLRQLLKELETERDDVAAWPGETAVLVKARNDIVSVALRPADASDSWRDWALAIDADRDALAAALSNVELVEASDEEREADAVALKIRSIIEDKPKTVMLVTPDRDLSRRVAVKMRRWNIAVDDSAGVPFPNAPCGTYLRLVAQWLADPSDAAALMAALRHPLFGGGLDDRERARAVNAMDCALRGLKPKPGANGLRDKIAESETFASKAEPVLNILCDALAHWPARSDFSDRLSAHVRIAEHLAATHDAPGADRLWRGEDGGTGAETLAGVKDIAGAVIHDEAVDYPDIFHQLIAKAVVRRRAPAHPRIAILGPLEARLQQADVVILGGLNEGVWPRDAAIDPFLSRPMRRNLGLPSPEQRIGLAAHDFAQLAAAPHVMLTRSTRAGGKPTKPSRWIVRLKNILTGAGALKPIERTHFYETLASRLDTPKNYKPVRAPRPRPPLNARPTEFYVTRIEKLLRDPYAVYARDILHLRKLDELNEPFAARHLGNLFHKVLQRYAAAPMPARHDDRIGALRALFDECAVAFGMTEEHSAFWRGRADEAFAWLAAWDAERRAEGEPVVIEGTGAWPFEVDGRAFSLNARADRIDRLHDGGAFIIDYKTGAPPTLKQTKTFSPQLPLTGLIAANGGFEALGAVPVAGFEYVRVVSRTGKSADNSGAAGGECADLIAEAETGLYALMRHFNDPSTSYSSQPRPQYMDDFGDYDHLARRRERNAQGGDE